MGRIRRLLEAARTLAQARIRRLLEAARTWAQARIRRLVEAARTLEEGLELVRRKARVQHPTPQSGKAKVGLRRNGTVKRAAGRIITHFHSGSNEARIFYPPIDLNKESGSPSSRGMVHACHHRHHPHEQCTEIEEGQGANQLGL